MLGTQELLIILFIIVLLFGAKKLPELARGLGKGIREFKNAANEVNDAARIDEKTTPNQEEKKSE